MNTNEQLILKKLTVAWLLRDVDINNGLSVGKRY